MNSKLIHDDISQDFVLFLDRPCTWTKIGQNKAIYCSRQSQDFWSKFLSNHTLDTITRKSLVQVNASFTISHKDVECPPGTLLTPSIKVLSTSVTDNVRAVVLQRAVNGSTSDHFDFPTSPGDLNMIGAVGDTASLAYHKWRSGGKATLIPSNSSACVCQPDSRNYLTYMDSVTQEFGTYDCLDEPRSDMLKHGDGTGREVPNQGLKRLFSELYLLKFPFCYHHQTSATR